LCFENWHVAFAISLKNLQLKMQVRCKFFVRLRMRASGVFIR